MPYPTEHAARLTDPSKYKSFARQNGKLGSGIDAIFGVLQNGKTELQAIRFSKEKFTPEQARKWISDHDFKPIMFEPASDKKTDSGAGVMVECVRVDRQAFRQKAEITSEGFLKTDAVVTRSGVFYYSNPDGTVRRELRPPEEVFNPQSMGTMKMIPITNKHPKDFVDAKNAKDLAVGSVGDNIRQDGETIVAPIAIHRGDAVEACKAGRRELSLGYKVDLIDEPGTYNGEPYDVKQTNIRYNHLALVDTARAGRDAAIHFDGIRLDDRGGFEISKQQYDTILDNSQTNNLKRKVHSMPLFKIDGIDYEAAQEVLNHIGRQDAKIEALTGEAKTEKGNFDSLTAERDDLKDKLTKEQEKNTDAAIAARVVARVDLEKKAALVLDAEGMKDIAKKTDAEIKSAVVAKACDGIDLKGKSAEYISARFDIAIETAAKNSDGTGDQFAAANGGTDAGAHTDEGNSEKAHDKMKKDQDEAYLKYGK